MENLRLTLTGNIAVVRWDKGDVQYSVLLESEPYQKGETRGAVDKPPVRPFRVARQGNFRRHPYQLNKSVPDKRYHGSVASHRKTTYLDAAAKSNVPMVAKALAEAERLGLYEQQAQARDAAEAEKIAARTAKRAAITRDALQQEKQALLAEGNLKAVDAIGDFLHDADDARLERFFLIVRDASNKD